ncbi:MAG: phosphoribosyl-ATP diphosphatase [Candidatus Melainabacteria bacterium]|nr:MAG: phosphoribosyl-ATP diphosphatase [Candidatus Melainabacteria bacterium]
MLIPSIDIKDGKVVQLRQGKELVLQSERDPLELAREFNRFGEVAVIDLDAAMGSGDNLELLKQLCRVADVRVGGGIRSVERGRALLRSGARQLIFGTAATPELLSNFPPDLVMVALDQRNGTVFDKGWQNSTGETVFSRANRLAPYCNAFLTTFIEQEGGLGGIPMEQVRELQEKVQKPLTVAGGIACTKEIVEISKLGIDVQVGMAIYTGRIDLADAIIGSITFNKDGLCPTIVQDEDGQVLMVAYSSPDSLKLALKEGKGVYFSRSRNEIWEKGLTSGNAQRLISCRVDCDRDTLLFTVEQKNGACHSGTYSCFAGSSTAAKFSLARLFKTLKERQASLPEASYSANLFRDRKLLFEKIAEESAEVVGFTSKENLRWEIADLLYFLSVLAVAEGIEWKDIESELGGRRR